jgi:hypothetical protein
MGGWYDHFGTLPPTYLEQARNTILGGARESLLFCYKQLHESKDGIRNIEALRPELEDLHKLAYLIEGKKPIGISVPKQPNADAETERYIAGMYPMVGIPAVADIKLDSDAQAVILGMQAAKYSNVRVYAKKMIAENKPVAFTEGFLAYTNYNAPDNAVIFRPGADIWNLTKIPQDELDSMRNSLLAPFGLEFYAPSRVALNLFDDDMEVIQNFNDCAVDVTIKINGEYGRDKKTRKIALRLSAGKADKSEVKISRESRKYNITVPPRTLIVLN